MICIDMCTYLKKRSSMQMLRNRIFCWSENLTLTTQKRPQTSGATHLPGSHNETRETACSAWIPGQ